MPAAAAWSFIIAASALLVAVSSPVLGALADGLGIKKRFLGAYCGLGVLATLALWFQVPWWAVGALILVGNIGFEGGNVFYNAFLPEVAGVREQHLVSSAGFSAGYVGGVLVLIAALLFFIPPKGSINDAFLLVGVWWGAFALVTFALMRERPARGHAQGNPVGRAFREVGATIKGIGRYPQAALFDKIGIRKMYLETGPYGNFLIQGYEFGTGRNWARLGNLYLTDGVAPTGERILPEGWVEYARTLAPAWEADGRPIYGGSFFWINGTGSFPIPTDAFYMAGAGGQNTIIIPSHQMVVVRLGHYKGSSFGGPALRNALTLLMEAVPPVE